MPFVSTDIAGLMVFEPKVFEDNRGYFFESYNEKIFSEVGISNPFVQDNQSGSSYGVIRGLHYQLLPYAQAKIVRVIRGRILDIAVDIRKNSPTYGKHCAIELSDENRKQFFIPAGFAHGFSVLSDHAEVMYKCDTLYNKESEAGIRFDDPELNIDWKVSVDKRIVSEKDLALPLLKECRNNFVFND